jgi:hypothetical protein
MILSAGWLAILSPPGGGLGAQLSLSGDFPHCHTTGDSLKAAAPSRANEILHDRLISEATYPAPKPLSILTTVTLDAQEFIIPSKAAMP